MYQQILTRLGCILTKVLSRIAAGVAILLFSVFALTPVVEKPKQHSKLIHVQIWASNQKYLIPDEDDLHMVYKAGIQNNVDPLLLLAVIGVESSFKSSAKSNAGAIGYMQVVPRWHLNKIDDVNKLWIPHYNINIGAAILGDLIDRYGLVKALQKYNGSTTKEYPNRVLTAYKRLLDEIK